MSDEKRLQELMELARNKETFNSIARHLSNNPHPDIACIQQYSFKLERTSEERQRFFELLNTPYGL